MLYQAHAFVEGRVQGVGFRAFTRGQACQLNITGFVKNLPDGRAEVLMEGSKDKIQQMKEFLGRGPATARVDNIDWQKEEIKQRKYEDFNIEY